MKLVGAVLLLCFTLGVSNAGAQVRGCTNQDPHSFACQQGTFFGKIFPLAQVSAKRLAGNWRTLVYTAPPRLAPVFGSRFSPRNPRIPTGVVNSDSSLVGTLSWPQARSIQFNNFRLAGNHLKQISQVQLSNATTANVHFLNPREGTRELLICRIFIRNQNDHLLCQWLRHTNQGFQFLGYFGFVR